MTTIYFATNRNPNRKTNPSSFNGEFSKTSLSDLRFGKADVLQGKFQPGSIAVLPDDEKKGSQALMGQLRETMKVGKTDSLIFIHGFNTTFVEALEAAGQLADAYSDASAGKYSPNIFVFSWPSDGKVVSASVSSPIGYRNDRHDAEASGLAFARGLMKLSAFLRNTSAGEACEQRVNLLAHSMGNYVLRHALQQANKIVDGNSLSRLFDNIILTAADEDSDAFQHDHKLARLPDLAQRISVYFNNGDLALKVSDYAKGNPDRLGHDGPNKPHELPAKVVLIDVSGVEFGVLPENFHSYHITNPKVVNDMLAILRGESSESDKLLRYYVPHANKFKLI